MFCATAMLAATGTLISLNVVNRRDALELPPVSSDGQSRLADAGAASSRSAVYYHASPFRSRIVCVIPPHGPAA